MVRNSGNSIFRRTVAIFCTISALTAVAMAQSGLSAAPAAGITANSAMQQLSNAQNPLLGSTPSKLDPDQISLTLLDAIDRGLKYNLGAILGSQATTQASAARMRALSDLMPNLNANVVAGLQQNSLSEIGFNGALFGMGQVIGPFTSMSTRATVRQNVINFGALQNYRASKESEKAAQFSYRSTRDLVVLVVGGQYLQALADKARVDAVQAEYLTAEALFKQANDQKAAGIIPGVDLLRAQVQMQATQQRLIAAQNELSKQLLVVGRVIGLPSGQKFVLADAIPAPAPVDSTLETIVQSSFQTRADLKEAEAQLRAAERTRAAAGAARYPSLGVQGTYGVAGVNPGNSHGVFALGATLNIPIYEGGRTEADILAADTAVKQRRSQYEDLKGRVEYEVRSAYLDYQSATKQLEVATSALDLSRKTLEQSRDRFAAGVTNSIEVVQAQEAEATAEENYISSLFGHNFSKLALARAAGVAEEQTKRFLGGKQ